MPTLINPEHIYPRRLGIYNYSSLVIEYYNFEKDVIKKHLIPFNPSESAKKNLEIILKNPKHSIFLRTSLSSYCNNSLVLNRSKYSKLKENGKAM